MGVALDAALRLVQTMMDAHDRKPDLAIRYTQDLIEDSFLVAEAYLRLCDAVGGEIPDKDLVTALVKRAKVREPEPTAGEQDG